LNDQFGGRLVERLRAGETLIGTFANLGSAIAAEICGAAGFDWVLVDLEHGSGSEPTLPGQLQAIAATPATSLVRVESHDRARIVRALDAGAAGVMVPRVDAPEQARAAVAATRYPPAGTRGVALMNRGAAFGRRTGAMEDVADLLLVVIQVESPEALQSAKAIGAVDGVDVLFVGPSDLSQSLGCFGHFDDAAYTQGVRAVADACRMSGKAAGVLAASAADAERYLEEGYRFVGVSGDGGFLAKTAAAAATELRTRCERSAARGAGTEIGS
jgi:2-keto-3-deoxy-L-rhamnonate aldolase RhmA